MPRQASFEELAVAGFARIQFGVVSLNSCESRYQ